MIGLGQSCFYLSWPAAYIFGRGTKRSRVLLICGNEVLLVKNRLGNGLWGLPGGGVKQGELPAVGASRELLEEVGVVARPEGLTQMGDFKMKLSNIPMEIHYFSVKVKKKPSLKIQKLEIADARWHDLDKLDLAELQVDTAKGIKLLKVKFATM